jgi:radical SAM protein with 4Fe4S-binding SPASM domain
VAGARVHRRLQVLGNDFRPAYVVWELTLACDQSCTHCGSRAGAARADELSTAEALRVVAELAAARAKEVVLIGGEAYLHPGFLAVIAALKAAGIRPTMTTGGRRLDAAMARQMAAAGLHLASVSIDGLAASHDLQRATTGGFAAAVAALGHLRGAGVLTAANTNINRLNRDDLEPLYEQLRGLGISSWQVQLTVPIGRAADRPDLLLQPWDLLELVPRLAALKRRAFGDGILIMPGNNLGYFGPEEGLLRTPDEGGQEHWQGCQAGRYVMGIESNGAVKGCPSLQTQHYVGGNLRRQSLAAIWNDDSSAVAFNRERTVDDLWGWCRTCTFADVCKGGCTFTAHSLFGRPGNNPYCHFRARTLARQGQRERLVRTEAPPGTPFDSGVFTLIVEPLDAPDVVPPPATRARLLKVVR